MTQVLLVHKTCERIKAAMAEGRFGPGDVLPPLRALSQQTQTPRDTVWRALKQMKEERILELTADRRYRLRSSVAREMLRGLDVLFVTRGRQRIANGVFQRFFTRMSEMGPQANVTPAIWLAGGGGADPDWAAYDALLVSGDAADAISRIRQAAACPPILGVNTLPGEDVDYWIRTDHLAGGRLAAQGLIARGYEHVAVVGGSDRDPMRVAAELRSLGFQQAWIEGGGSLDHLQLTRLPGDSLARNFQYLDQYVADHPQVECFFGVSDSIALALCDVLKARGRHIPRDVGVIGLDGSEWAYLQTPPLTTLKQEMEEMAEATVRRVRRLGANQPDQVQDRLVPVEWIEGGTLRPGPVPQQADRRIL